MVDFLVIAASTAAASPDTFSIGTDLNMVHDKRLSQNYTYNNYCL